MAFGGQDGVEITGGEAAVHSGMTEGPVDVSAATQCREFDRVGHLLQDAFGADGGCFFEPHRRAGTQRQERLLGGGAGTDAVVAGNFVAVVWEVTVVDGGAAQGGASVPGHLDWTTVIECADDHLVGAVVVTDPHGVAQ